MAEHNDFTWNRGEDILLTFTMSPVENIAGWTISFVVKQNVSDAVAILSKTGAVTSAAGGVFTVSVTAADNTNVLSSGGYVHAVERTDSGSVAVLSEGSVLIKPTAKLA